MGFGLSLSAAATGAVLTWGAGVELWGVDSTVLGVVLLAAGAAGLVLSVLFRSSWGGPATIGRRRDS